MISISKGVDLKWEKDAIKLWSVIR